MKCIIQRVNCAEVKVEGESKGKIQKGLLVYLGFSLDDNNSNADYIIDRISKIRLFEDENGKLNKSLKDVEGNILLIPNFTLYADATTGRRPSFVNAMKFDEAKALFGYCLKKLSDIGIEAQSGVFGADMKIESVADGPVNIIIEII